MRTREKATARRIAACSSIVVMSMLCQAVAADENADENAAEKPGEILARHGLVNLGDAWLCPAEAEARKWLDAFHPLERQYQVLQRALDERVEANEATKKELAQKRRELKKLEERIKANDPAALGPTRDQLKQSAKELEAQIKRKRRDYMDGTRLAEFQSARDDVVRLANARAGLTLAAAAFRQRLAQIPQQYERIGKIAAVRAALSRLGPAHRLGTGRNYASDAADRLARIDRATLSNVVPIYRDDKHARVLAIVDGATPVTFSLRQSNGPTHLPHSLVTSLNLSTHDAPRVTYTVGDRKLACRMVKLSSVRVGGLEMRDVEAVALPPEGEDLGAKLGRAAYESHYFDVDYSHLRLTILSAESKTDPPMEDRSPSSGAGDDGAGDDGEKGSKNDGPAEPTRRTLRRPAASGR